MMRYQNSVTDRDGNVLAGAVFTLYMHGSPSTPAAMFKDEDFTDPYTDDNVTDVNGYLYLYAEPGRYDLEVEFNGEVVWYEDILFFDPEDKEDVGVAAGLVATETAARIAADTAEATARANADTALQTAIDNLTAADVGADPAGTAAAAVAALVDSSPAALDTLNELADALGNDPNFATTILNVVADETTEREADVAELQSDIDEKIGGTAGVTDEAVPRADGAGGLTLQGSKIMVDDSGRMRAHGSHINTQTDNYTLVAADAGKIVEMNKATAVNLTVPPQASVAWEDGAQVGVVDYGAGTLTIVPGAGVSVRAAESKLKIDKQYASGVLVRRAADEWYFFGGTAV